MLKLMKYELIKQRTSKVIIGAILALLEVAFLAGMLLGNEEIMAIAAGLSLELLDSQISPWYVPSTESCRRCLIR